MISAYSRLLDRHPVVTKCVTSGILFSFGDVVSQLVIEKKKEFDWKRNLFLTATGGTYIAPALHVWYCKLLPIINNTAFKTWSKTGKVFGSMALDQLAFAPTLLFGFFIFHSGIQGNPMKGVEVAKDKIMETLYTNWKIWPAATLVNFWFMPLKYQVLFANFIGFFWNIILSYITYK